MQPLQTDNLQIMRKHRREKWGFPWREPIIERLKGCVYKCRYGPSTRPAECHRWFGPAPPASRDLDWVSEIESRGNQIHCRFLPHQADIKRQACSWHQATVRIHDLRARGMSRPLLANRRSQICRIHTGQYAAALADLSRLEM